MLNLINVLVISYFINTFNRLEREVGSSQARLLRRELARPASQLLAALLKWTAFQFVESAEPPPAGS
jgi:hypothetical protein